jgi:YVTN family beta-propeller protein
MGLFLFAAGCTASAEDVRPPADQFFFPTGASLSPDHSLLFMINANTDLRYDSGSLAVVDLAVVDAVANAWTSAETMPSGCRRDDTQRNTLVCDEAQFIRDDAGVRIGNFATNLSVQELGSADLRLITAVRGDPSVTWAEWDGTSLRCAESAQGYALCDDAHRLIQLRNDEDLALLPEEPYGVFADSTSEVALVTHLTSGAVTLVDSRADASPVLSDVVTGLFDSDPNTGVRGAVAVAARTPGGLLYVTSRSEDRIQMLTVHRDGDAPPVLVPSNYFFLDGVGINNGGSSDTRAAVFSNSGDRLYLVNREPPSLQVYDTALDATGFPRNLPLAATDLCREASNVAVADVGDGDRAYVTCFRDGEVYVIDPRGRSEVEAIVTAGRGPFAAVASASRQKLYVSNFLEDTVAVIELAPGSPFRNQVILRIGEPRS